MHPGGTAGKSPFCRATVRDCRAVRATWTLSCPGLGPHQWERRRTLGSLKSLPPGSERPSPLARSLLDAALTIQKCRRLRPVPGTGDTLSRAEIE
jgi:hypothetical protein